MRRHRHYSGPRPIATGDLGSQMVGDHRAWPRSLRKTAKKESDIDRRILTLHMSIED